MKKINTMKNSLIIAMMLFTNLTFSQDIMDNMYQKYAGKNGFTSINIGKGLLEFVSSLDNDKNAEEVTDKISDLKILVANQNEGADVANFSNEIKSLIDKNAYLNLMEVIDGREKVNFYAKKADNMIVHLVMIATGSEEEVLMSIKGQFSKEDLVKIGKDSNCSSELSKLSLLNDLEE